MKKIFLLAVAATVFVQLQAQTLDEVLAKYATAMGGKAKLDSIQSLYMEGVTVRQDGGEMTMKFYKIQDKLSRREIDFGMGTMVTIVTPQKGWMNNPRNPGGSMEPMPEERLKQMQTDMDCTSPLYNYAAKGHKAELQGKETVEGAECYKIKLTTKGGSDITFFIDTKTNYIVRESRTGGAMGGGRGGAQTINIDYSDYKTLDGGFVFATKTSTGMGSLNYEKIEVNKAIDIDKLGKPE